MSLLPIRVDGSIHCQTAQQAEQHAFSYGDATSSAVPTSEAGSLHALVDLLTAARNDSNRFLSALIAKYPKAVDNKGGRRKKRGEEEEDEAAEDEQRQDDGPQLDASANVTVPLSTDYPMPATTSDPRSATSEPDAKRPKLDNP